MSSLHQHYVRKFGHNADCDSGDDIWDGSAPYPFPSAAATTTIVSDSAEDDPVKGDQSAGTGAYLVEVQGLDANYLELREQVTLNGIAAVTLQNQFLRAHRAIVLTGGTAGENAGNIQVKHGATVILQISAGMGQTLMTVYTLPANTWGWLCEWQVTKDGAGSHTMALQVRPFGGMWNTKELAILNPTGTTIFTHEWRPWARFAPKTDFRVRAVSGANAVDVTASFAMLLNSSSRLEFL